VVRPAGEGLLIVQQVQLPRCDIGAIKGMRQHLRHTHVPHQVEAPGGVAELWPEPDSRIVILLRPPPRRSPEIKHRIATERRCEASPAAPRCE
jgi:hypothetical protein